MVIDPWEVELQVMIHPSLPSKSRCWRWLITCYLIGQEAISPWLPAQLKVREREENDFLWRMMSVSAQLGKFNNRILVLSIEVSFFRCRFSLFFLLSDWKHRNNVRNLPTPKNFSSFNVSIRNFFFCHLHPFGEISSHNLFCIHRKLNKISTKWGKWPLSVVFQWNHLFHGQLFESDFKSN